jgi:hypothetical protein
LTSVKPEMPSLVAVTVTVPFFSPRASPLLLTDTLELSALDQVTTRPVNTLLRASYNVAVS